MKAVYREGYGSSEVLEIRELEKPNPGNNEILIKVYATTVNRTDCAILSGKPYIMRLFTGLPKPKRPVPGTDFAGVVGAIGKEVKNFKTGDRVWGLHDEGFSSQAQYIAIEENKSVILMPENFNFDEAVASAEGSHYAYNFFNKVNLKSGMKVLVNGATGAIGSSSMQMLKDKGIYVTAVGNTKNLDLLKSLGADKVFNYESEDFTNDDEKYHFIFDSVGKSSFPACKHLLLPGGAYISSELGPGAQNLYLALTTRFRKRRVIYPFPSNCKRSLLYMKSLIEKGAFRAVIDRKYSMDDIAEAYDYVQSGQKTGNVIIHYWDS